MKENGVITAWPILPFRKMTAYDINLIYEIKEEFDKKGNWKGYRISVTDNNQRLNPIKPYDVPIKYDQNKELDKVKSFNGLQ